MKISKLGDSVDVAALCFSLLCCNDIKDPIRRSGLRDLTEKDYVILGLLVAPKKPLSLRLKGVLQDGWTKTADHCISVS